MKPPPTADELFSGEFVPTNIHFGATRNRNYSQGASLEAIYKRDKAICWICKGHVKFKDASRDHIKPFSGGGTSNKKNLKLAHRDCNSQRGNK